MADSETLPMNEVVTKVLESFQEPRFAGEVETFVNTNINLFAVPTQDGSHPIDWTMQHKKYKKMYESQLQKALDSNGADATDFMGYMQQCQDAYGSDPNFQSVLTTLTRSEDYNSFLQLMFQAVRDNWEPDPAVPEPAGFQVHQVDVAVPEGVGPGMLLPIEYLGLIHQVAVPDGFGPGSVIRVQLQVPTA
mmetsp:Transcript_102865/g.320519  ORF Transcript_102865/g.320519 Transcript_102865/m.320519 type:complete len:191 (+) Transcript_102865:48-620(+)|eukprot:CAMPEP_0204572570 /NCGR_PEP_ID=MMETSP0661-20131031/39537_1 /ASSEMBLY_ACC=CAM_ASM_000606 /TAXON_ID=109239 /ORGANISM="Alexandrium margalefi, Strain AMGDE01CS-322" /LENGTH=190 /DNA_ID=CAMNT_0051580935 /DNA_START=48 /DNA_END=620 /DNA_ORIENTATION=+